MQEMTAGHEAGWTKLHHINLRLGVALGPQLSRFGRKVKHTPPEVITENCDILARGTEEEIKDRINWLRMFYPAQFNEPIKA